MASLFNKKGFTLIELLVAVLIIGILAAIALPQYQKAVERSQASQLKILVKAIADAEEAYFLATNKYTVDFTQLDVSLPGGVIKNGRGVCNVGSLNFAQFDKFEMVINTSSGTEPLGVTGYRTAGKYKCSGFYYGWSAGSRKILCSEPAGSAAAAKGVYCALMGYPNLINTSQWNDKLYSD